MPIWDFKCPNCGYIEEDVFFRRLMGIFKPRYCPKCKTQMERMLPSGITARFRHGGKVNYYYTKHSDPDSEQVGHQY